MTTNEIIALLAAIFGTGGLGAFARWLVGIWRETSKENTATLVKAQQETRDALVRATESNVEVTGVLHQVVEGQQELAADVRQIRDRVIKHLDTVPPPTKRHRTNPMGTAVRRTTNRDEGDD